MKKIISRIQRRRHLNICINGFDQEENAKIRKELEKLIRRINFSSKNRNGEPVSYEISFN